MDWPRILASVQLASGQRTDDQRLERTRARIDAQCCEPLSVKDLARGAHMSREHFIRSFKRAYGLTPHQYLTRQRVLEARRLLETTQIPITEVCLEVGFSSLGSFGAMFKRHVGHSPTRYRRRLVQSLGLVELPFVPTCFALRFGHFSRSASAGGEARLRP